MANKIGVFGGAFNPIHYGHISSLLQVKEKMSLHEIKVIPSFQSPGKELIDSPSPSERLHLLELGLSPYLGEDITIDPRELNNATTSYTIDTLTKLKEQHPLDELHLILGLDQFHQFDSWKSPLDILKLAHLVITSRPGHFFPLSVSDFSETLQPHILDYDGYTAQLKQGTNIFFIRLEDQAISSSDIRKKVRLNQSISRYVPIEVENYIREKSLYSNSDRVDYNPKELQEKIDIILSDLGGNNTLSFDFRDKNQITDFNIITSTQSKKATSRLAEKVIEEIKNQIAVKPLQVDGKTEGNWIVIDYGSVMIHLFHEPIRNEYNLEKLWANYPMLPR